MSCATMSDWASQLRAYKSQQASSTGTAGDAQPAGTSAGGYAASASVASSAKHHPNTNGTAANTDVEHRQDARIKIKASPLKNPSSSHIHRREKVSMLGNKNLERCVQLLNKMMLESDSDVGVLKKSCTSRGPLAKAHTKASKNFKPRHPTAVANKKVPKAKVKSHAKKPKKAKDIHKVSSPKISKSTNIQPTDFTKFDLPVRDSNLSIAGLPLHHQTEAVHFNTGSFPLPVFQPVSVPFNKRLSTSTPTQPLDSVSPWKYVPGSSQSICSEEYHLTRMVNNPLNATDQCKQVAAPVQPDPQPKLTEAAYTHTDNPRAQVPTMSSSEGITLNEGYSLYSASTSPTKMSSKSKTFHSDALPLCSWRENTVVEAFHKPEPAVVSSFSQSKPLVASTQAAIQPTVLPPSITQPMNRNKQADDPKRDTETQTSVHDEKEIPPPQKLRALSDLLKDLRSAVSAGNLAAMPGLVADLEATSCSMVWGKKVNQQLEMDLALQPLRTENAQLRRQLRLANLAKKGNQDKVKCEEHIQQDFNVVHVEMMRHQLEATLREERAAMERLRESSCHLQTELHKMSEEKQQLLVVIMKKDEDYVQELDKILSDRKKLHCEVGELKAQRKDNEREMSQQLQLNRVEIKGREEEIKRLQDLVGNLQASMRRLLTDLQTRPDSSCKEIAETTQSTLDSMLNSSDAKGIMDDQFNGIQVKLLSPRGSDKSARRSLFSKQPQAISSGSSQNLAASISDNLMMTMSEYDLPPGASPFSSKFRVNEGLTVKELLTPLADRMQNQFHRMNTVKPEDIVGYSSIESDSAESESTLVEEEEGKEASRYSITDYFTKYASNEKPASLERLSELENSSDTSPSPLKSSLRPSLQSSLYKGTDLDSSLSTIPGAEDGRSVVSSEVSTDTISSVDDHAFKRGLAALDANISHMQQQLRITSQ